MNAEKCVNHTGVAGTTAYRKLTDLAQRGLLLRNGQGRDRRYGRVVGG
jgi:DeoR/GlpR family transcriptional regulator of sugar metabolism